MVCPAAILDDFQLISCVFPDLRLYVPVLITFVLLGSGMCLGTGRSVSPPLNVWVVTRQNTSVELNVYSGRDVTTHTLINTYIIHTYIQNI